MTAGTTSQKFSRVRIDFSYTHWGSVSKSVSITEAQRCPYIWELDQLDKLDGVGRLKKLEERDNMDRVERLGSLLIQFCVKHGHIGERKHTRICPRELIYIDSTPLLTRHKHWQVGEGGQGLRISKARGLLWGLFSWT